MAGNSNSGQHAGHAKHGGRDFAKGDDPRRPDRAAWIRQGTTGWRKRAALEDLREQAMKGQAKTPLQFALDLMNNADESMKVRMWACQVSMPYCHARIVQVQGDEQKPLVVATSSALRKLSEAELQGLMHTMGKLNGAIAREIDAEDFEQEQKALPYQVEDAEVVAEVRRPRNGARRKPSIR